MNGALAALDTHDMVFVHVEAPDEAASRAKRTSEPSVFKDALARKPAFLKLVTTNGE